MFVSRSPSSWISRISNVQAVLAFQINEHYKGIIITLNIRILQYFILIESNY